MAVRTEEIRAKSERVPARNAMPLPVRYAVTLLLAAIVAGALYLIAVRGDALLSDLAGIAALICG